MSQHSLSIIVHLNEGPTAGTHVPRDTFAEVDPSDCDMERYPSVEMHQGQMLLHGTISHTSYVLLRGQAVNVLIVVLCAFSRRRDGVLSRCPTLRTCASTC